jgi:hypothetical protein
MAYPAYSYYSLAPVYVSPPPAQVYVNPLPAPSYAVPAESYNPPPVAMPSEVSEGAVMEAPALPPGQPSTYAPLPSSSDTMNGEKAAETQEVQKPATAPDTKSEPKAAPNDAKPSGPELNPQNTEKNPSNVKPNSLQNSQPNDSRDYTARKPLRQASRENVMSAQPAVRVLSPNLWQPAND